MKAKSALTVALAAGIASTAAASNSPTTLSPTQGAVQDIAHIYYNAATGERVVTVLGDGQTAPAQTGDSAPLWSALVGNACASAGFTTSFFFGVDEANGTTSLATNITNLDFGDIETDTVVDCLHLNWVVEHPDTDTDADGIGDGVTGLGANWMVWDADNGRDINRSTRLPLVSATLFDLPGNIADPGFLSAYTLDLDLVATFTGTDLSFEIGTTDDDCGGAAFCNNEVLDFSTGDTVPVAQADNNFDGLPDSDLDGDGLFDWSWTVRFLQPGTTDFDGDGNPDGTFPAPGEDLIGISFGSPEGTALDNGDGSWTWEVDTSVPDAGTGVEDAFAIYAPPDSNGDIVHAGFFWFGGFACEPDPADGTYTPPAHFEFQLLGPGGANPCPADLNGDNMLNFFDISAFIQAFNAMDPIADFQADGQFNFFDISAFIQAFNAGCP